MEIALKKFSRQEITLLREEIQSALDTIKAKYALAQLTLGSISYNEISFTSKILAALPDNGNDSDAFANEEARFFARRYGLPDNVIQRRFVSNGKSHTIIRIETRNIKYPIITRCSDDGKTYKFSVQHIKEILENVLSINYNDSQIKPGSNK